MRMLRRNALSFLTFMPIAAAGESAFAAPVAVPEEKPKTAGKILFVVTSHGELGNTGRKTGYWLSEVTRPWKVLKDAGYEIDFMSPKGGECPVEGQNPSDPVNKAFAQDLSAQKKINFTIKPSEVKPEEYKAIFFAGGHGVMWDFPDNKELAAITSKIYENGGVVAAVCHGPAALINVKLSNGKFLVDGKKINSFTNSEEKGIGLDKVVPFALETALVKRGAKFQSSDNFQSHVVVNDRVITGQNPMSATAVGDAIRIALQN